jgi:GTP-binding nuclear protein Ran
MFTYKVCVIGDGASGKTALVSQLTAISAKTEQVFPVNYVPTIGVEVHPITFNTSRGLITLNVWDISGQERSAGLRDGYYINAQAFIGTIDGTQVERSLKKLVEMRKDAYFMRPNVPFIKVCTKNDLGPGVQRDDVICVSALTKVGLRELITELLRKLTRDSALTVNFG